VQRGRRHRRHGAGRVGRPLNPEGPGRTPCLPGLGQEWGLAEGQVRQDPRVPQGIVSFEEGGNIHESANVRLENGARA
jgi:hypothetical protein